MALPTSGQLALSAIRDEFGAGTTSNVNLRTLSAAAGLSVPDGFNEFYGLASYTRPTLGNWGTSQSGAGTQANPYVITSTTWDNYNYDEPVGSCGEYIADIEFYTRYRVSERGRSTAFTNQFSGPQRVHVTMTNITSSNFTCEYNPYFATAVFNMYGSGISLVRGASYPTNTDLKAQVQNITTDFNTSAGTTIGIVVGALQPRNELGYQCGYYPDDSYIFYDSTLCGGSTPSISSCTLSIWFEKL
jgi:hypothetical protein